MSSYLKKLVVLGALVAALLCASPAQAALTLEISTDAGVTFMTFTAPESATFVSGAAAVGTAMVTVSATTNEPTGADFAQVSQVQLNFNNSGAIAQAIPLVVRISDRDFDAPGGLSVLSSSFSGTVNGSGTTAGLVAATFQSAADFSNTLFGGLPGIVTSGPVATTGLQAVVIPIIGGGTASFGGDTNTLATSTPPFSLSNEFRITGLTIGAGASLQLTGTTTLTAVPAPAGVMLALTALPLLGFGHWLQRRKSEVKPV